MLHALERINLEAAVPVLFDAIGGLEEVEILRPGAVETVLVRSASGTASGHGEGNVTVEEKEVRWDLGKFNIDLTGVEFVLWLCNEHWPMAKLKLNDDNESNSSSNPLSKSDSAIPMAER